MRTAVVLFALALLVQAIGCQLVVILWAFKAISIETTIAWVSNLGAIPLGCFIAMLAVIRSEYNSARKSGNLQ